MRRQFLTRQSALAGEVPPPAAAATAAPGRRRRRFLVAASLAAAVALSGAAPAQAWVRREGHWWTYYLPTSHWVAAESANGIDISSPTGVLYVGYGFSSSAFPLTPKQVVAFTVRSGGLDVHPLRSVRFTSQGRDIHVNRTTLRRVYQWQGVRTDRRQAVRGVFTVDVFNNAAAGSYGFAGSTRVTPTSQFKRQYPLLVTVSQRIFFHPRTPDFAPIDS